MERDLPLVSIIITNYNGKAIIKNCIDSIMGLDYPKDRREIILVDDHSGDGTTDFVEGTFPFIKIIHNNENVGAAESRNIGIAYAKGDLLAFLDNDAEISKSWLYELVNIMMGDEEIGACVPKLLFNDIKGTINSAGGILNFFGDGWDRGIFEKDIGQYEKIERVFFGCSAAILVRRDVLERVGYFDSKYFYLYEDLDLGWRINMAGYKVMYVPKAVAYHKAIGRAKINTFKGKYLIERNRIRTLLKNYEFKTLIKNALRLSSFKIKGFIEELKDNKGSEFLILIEILKAWFWNFTNLFDTFKERRHIQRIRKISDEEIIKLLGEFKDKAFEHETSH